MDTTVADFETKKIEGRPVYPPRPVGLALKHPDKRKEYLAWDHPEGNNCDLWVVKEKLREAARGRMIFHNAAFDMDIMDTFFGLRPKEFEDTLYLSFLHDPRAESMALKDQAHLTLGMPPDEQSDLEAYVIENIKGAKRAKKKWGEHIGECPGNIVAPYAIGDVDRTDGLFKRYMPDIERRCMMAAYQREKDLTWITLDMERSGIRVDVKRLRQCEIAFDKMFLLLEKNIRKRLGVDKGLKLTPKNLGDALVAADLLSVIIKTPKGKISTKADVLKKTCNDQKLLRMMSVQSVVKKYLNTFIRPWLIMAEVSGGRILPTFNQVRGRNDRSGGGTRTGRYSSQDPNLQQVATNVDDSKNAETLTLLQKWLREYCEYDFLGLRDYLIPDEGMILCSADYDQQELRLLAHFENDQLRRLYDENPNMDGHELVRQKVLEVTGTDYGRKSIKTTNFGLIYGMGVMKLALQLGMARDEAQDLKSAILETFPGIKKFGRKMSDYEDEGAPFRTWGGREYYTEDPEKDEHGEMRHFGYKNVNTRIQGSAADVTKEGMIKVRVQVPEARIAVQVHDELIAMIPHKKYAKRVAAAMCDIPRLRVPMLVTPKLSTESWARAA